MVKGVLKAATILAIYSYGLWYGCADLFYSFLPFGLIPAVLALCGIQYLKVPKPPALQLEKIVGKDFFYEEDADDAANVMKTVAHRGAGLDAPENSLAAFKLCKEKGCNFIEFDVMLTKDAVPVVFHDETLERMAGIDKHINKLTWEELKKVDLSVNHPFRDRFKPTRIPLLDETIKLLLELEINMFIDIKNNDRRMVKIIMDLFRNYVGLNNKAIVTSFYPWLLYMIRSRNPTIVCSMAYRPHFFSHTSYSYLQGRGPRREKQFHKHAINVALDHALTWCLPYITHYFIGLSLLLLHKDCVSGEIVNNWRRRGIRVCVWTVNQPCDKQFFSRNMRCTYLTDTLTGESAINLVPR